MSELRRGVIENLGALAGFDLTPEEVAAVIARDERRLISLGLDERIVKRVHKLNGSGSTTEWRKPSCQTPECVPLRSERCPTRSGWPSTAPTRTRRWPRST